MFKLTSQIIDPALYLPELENFQSGAVTTFEGRVRDHNDGRAVSGLEYEALQPLCDTEAQKIMAEAQKKFEIKNVICIHRTGKLLIGELAVWVGVDAGHRDASFKACRYVIDELKKRLPIWKKEFYTDGQSGWVNCQHSHSEISENDYYSRQTVLSEVGIEGQQKLREAKVLVVGAGGLGSAALMSLAQAGVGTIGICEADKLEVSNLHRQPLYSSADIGKPKIDLAEKFLKSLNPFVSVQKYPERLTPDNFQKVVLGYGIILDCTDNFQTKFLLNDIAVLHKKVLIQASIYQFEGQLRVYDPASESSCLRCLWPQIPEENCIGTCAEAGVLGVVPAMLGNLQALEAIKKILGLPSLSGLETLIVDLKTYGLSRVKQFKNSSCPVCGSSPAITSIEAKNYSPANIFSVDLTNVSLNEYILVDTRSSDEAKIQSVEGLRVLNLPSTDIGHWQHSLEQNKKYLFFCTKGFRSSKCVEQLRSKGFTNTWSVSGGYAALRDALTHTHT